MQQVRLKVSMRATESQDVLHAGEVHAFEPHITDALIGAGYAEYVTESLPTEALQSEGFFEGCGRSFDYIQSTRLFNPAGLAFDALYFMSLLSDEEARRWLALMPCLRQAERYVAYRLEKPSWRVLFEGLRNPSRLLNLARLRLEQAGLA